MAMPYTLRTNYRDHTPHHRLPISQVFSATNYGHIFLYDALTRPNIVWYLEPLDTVIACAVQGDVLDIYGIASPHACDLDAILRGLNVPGVAWIRFHFTPDLMPLPTREIARNQRESPFFVRGPLPMQRPFRFPAMGET